MFKSISKSIFVLLCIVSSSAAIAKDIIEEKITCGDVEITLASMCSDRLERLCIDQILKLDSKTISLKNSRDRTLWAEGWTCVRSEANNEFLMLSFHNGGNCESCEIIEIFDLKGTRLSVEGKDFRSVYKALKLPVKFPILKSINIWPSHKK